MPELPHPAAPADPPPGGLPGDSPDHHDPQVDDRLRAHLLRLSLLPASVVTVLGAAAVGYLLVATRTEVMDRAVLLLALVGCVAVLAVATRQARAVNRSILARLDSLRSSAAQDRSELRRLVERIRRGELIEPPAVQPTSSPGQQVEVFVNLARRLQSLVHREIQLLDDLENQVEDPDLLKGLFQVDHLATRIRRHAENLAVLGGAVSRRQWSRPVALTEVLRSAIAEVEHYSRVKLVPPVEGTLSGHAVADVIHLVAELVENATMFSPPQTQVLLRVQAVAAGVAVEVEDRGLGMAAADRERLNSLLADSATINIGEMLRDGRIGLFVVSAIARRHGITVRLQNNIYGGTQAVLVLPPGLLGAAPRPGEPQYRSRQQAAEPTQEQPVISASPRTFSPQTASPQSISPQTASPRTAPPAAAPAQQPPGGHPPVTPTLTTTNGSSSPHGAARTRPPLPHRRRQAHLAPQLQGPSPTALTEQPTADHDPHLMATFMRGVSRSENESNREGDPAARY